MFEHLGRIRKRAVLHQSFGGYLNRAITILQGLLLIPLYLHFLGETLYGYWLAVGGVIGWLGAVDMGISSVFIQKIGFAFSKDGKGRLGTWFASGLAIYFGLCILFVGLGFAVSRPLVEWLVTSGEESQLITECFRLMVLAAAIGLFNDALRGFAQAILRPVIPAFVLAVARLLGIAVTIIGLFQGLGVYAIAYGALCTSIFGVLGNLGYDSLLLRQYKERISVSQVFLHELIRVAPATFFSRVGRASVQNVEPFLITALAGPQLATMYFVSKRAVDMLLQIVHTFSFSFFPSFSGAVAVLSDDTLEETVNGFFRILFGGALVGLSCYVALNETFISLWVGPEVFAGPGVTVLLALGSLMLLLEESIVRILNGLGDFVGPSFFVFAESASRVTFISLGVYLFGMKGVALAVLFSTLAFSLLLQERVRDRVGTRPINNAFQVWCIPAVLVFTTAVGVQAFLPEHLGWGEFLGVGGVCLVVLGGMARLTCSQRWFSLISAG